MVSGGLLPFEIAAKNKNNNNKKENKIKVLDNNDRQYNFWRTVKDPELAFVFGDSNATYKKIKFGLTYFA